MPNPRKPIEVREAHGTAADHPGRQNHDAPRANGGIGPAPAWFDYYQREVWDEVVGQMHAGAMGQADRTGFELLVSLLVEYRVEPHNMKTSRLQLLVSLLSKYGMTPTDRTRLVIPKDGERKNPFAALDRLGNSE